MDENTLYTSIGKLYTELANAGGIIQNQNNIINKLKIKISELESSLGAQNISSRQAKKITIEDESMPSYSPIPQKVDVPESD